MTKKKNYLIGKAEALTKTTPPPKMKMDKVSLYTWEEVVSRLQHQFINVSNELKMLNDDLCPKDSPCVRIVVTPK
ncbi:hypothetical protein TUM4637_40880 [Shewanella hafniensis]|uniref:hypothetical protein n=1 Tax=Shewanella hafniensis TaxID=365590 RepID=UPI001BC7F65A|nr:hypothetical protein [Shewanella hafniensis]GIU39149.1 hypothetical protein TUM4637_40880 [Shewanella hafniensis]